MPVLRSAVAALRYVPRAERRALLALRCAGKTAAFYRGGFGGKVRSEMSRRKRSFRRRTAKRPARVLAENGEAARKGPRDPFHAARRIHTKLTGERQ